MTAPGPSATTRPMIYLLRHGQTEYNAEGRYQGRAESSLTERGRAQALAYAAALKPRVRASECVILSSPLSRARQTAAIVGEALGGAPVVVEPDLTELSLGAWEGRTAAEIDAGWPGARDAVPRNMWFFHAPDGEDLASATRRVGRALAAAGARPEPVRILVSHAVVGRLLRGIYLGLDPLKAARLEIPQEAFFALSGEGVIERIACPG
ncbi:histidine phosphatase family protein [Oceaniglobus roseus]|uniref:histidine phosphatase family protein n=1 Tax=Oceaniglobus roseus TaxID=1737570 RepID=UPI0015625C25|nr:histidine phosphatase family protein [Kandeliimicrobium roseum]